MTTTESVRHNARVLLPRMRGKPKAERMATYRALSGGPIGVVFAAVAAITTCPPFAKGKE